MAYTRKTKTARRPPRSRPDPEPELDDEAGADAGAGDDDILPGAQVAKQLGIYLGQLYGWVKAGKVVNHKVGGYPEGKGVEVSLGEAKAAWMASKKKTGPRKAREPRAPKVRNAEGQLVAEPPRRRLKTGQIVSYSSQPTKAMFDQTRRPRFTVAQVLGSNGHLTYLDPGKHRVTYDGRVLDDVVFLTDRLSTMLSKGVARIEDPVLVLGMVLLSFVVEERLELAESLESWMIENGLDVHVPEIVDVGVATDDDEDTAAEEEDDDDEE